MSTPLRSAKQQLTLGSWQCRGGEVQSAGGNCTANKYKSTQYNVNTLGSWK